MSEVEPGNKEKKVEEKEFNMLEITQKVYKIPLSRLNMRGI